MAAAAGRRRARRLLQLIDPHVHPAVRRAGLKFFDYDNDGLIDLFLANGHPDDMIEQYSQQVRYKMPLLLFRNDGKKLANVSKQAGPIFQKPYPARGLAVGDLNNDGRLDVLIGNNGEAPVLLRNNAGEGYHWLGVKLQGTSCNRDAVGATITWSVNGTTRSRYKTSGGSYLSSHDLREVLGLGPATTVDWLEVKWPQPSGRRRALHRRADRPLRHDRRRQGPDRNIAASAPGFQLPGAANPQGGRTDLGDGVRERSQSQPLSCRSR